MNLQMKNARIKIIHPYSSIRTIFDVIMTILLLFNLILLPLQMTLTYDNVKEINQQNPGWNQLFFWMKVVSDLWFLIDIFLNFRTGYVTNEDEGKIVINEEKIFWNYVTGWFFLDFISTIPFDVYLQIFGKFKQDYNLKYYSDLSYHSHETDQRIMGNNFSLPLSPIMSRAHAAELQESADLKMLTLVKVFKLTKVAKLFRLQRLVRVLRQMERQMNLKYESLSILIEGVVFSLLIFMVMHILGVLQFYIPYLMERDDSLSDWEQKLSSKSWLIREGYDLLNNKVSLGGRWVMGIYRSSSQMFCIGYGVTPPEYVVDTLVVIICMYSALNKMKSF